MAGLAGVPEAPVATGAVFDHFACLAAKVTGAAASVVCMNGLGPSHSPRQSFYGLSRRDVGASALIDELRGWPEGLTVIADMRREARFADESLVTGHLQIAFVAHLPLLSPSGERIGYLCVLDRFGRPCLTSLEIESLQQIADLIIADRKREQRHAHVMHVANQALRADRMLRVVTEAGSCATALTSLLEELCRFHDSALGHIWELTLPDGQLSEISRFSVTPLENAAPPLPADPAQLGASATAEVIRGNRARATVHSALQPHERPRTLPYAVEAGFRSHVSVPIWVQQQRFGLSLAFTTDRLDLQSVVDDVMSLANTIRPALFRKITEERIRFAAHHDELTGLSNRRVFQELLAEAVAAASRTGRELALLYLDLDGFKVINDSRGHDVGDMLLTAVAARIQNTVRAEDVVARLGGDEFVILQHLEGQPSAAASLSQRLINALSVPFEIGGQASAVGVSIGIAAYPGDGDTPGRLIRNADTALYRAKEAGRNTFRSFDPSMEARQQLRLLIKQDLHAAMAQQQITLAYQPICDAASLEVRGFEALMRWAHPVRGTITPDEFIPVAEATGIIMPLGRWALEAACSEAARWDPAVCLSVNLSPTQFRQPDLPQQIAGTLGRTGFPGNRLDLEVTEGLLLDSSGLVLRNMRALREQGVRITLDDFGTAYASLSYLRRFPFDRIKIDRSFVQGMGDDDATLAIVQVILSLGRRLNLAVVAEGVETERQLRQLRELGCQFVQGFLTGRPTPGPSEQYRLKERQVPAVARSGDVEHSVRPIVNTWSADPGHAPDLA
jgi:diguanylate cyclase (GGDEF)-like protein